MFNLNDTMRYFLCPGRTDMRKGISSLCGVVHEKMNSEVRNGDVFIFIGSSRRLMKLLHAEDGGMVMQGKRDIQKDRLRLGKAISSRGLIAFRSACTTFVRTKLKRP